MTSKFYMIVNGNGLEAARAASDRGIPLVFKSDYPMRYDLAPGEWRTLGYSPLSFLDKINAWYAETQCEADSRRIGALLSFHRIGREG